MSSKVLFLYKFYSTFVKKFFVTKDENSDELKVTIQVFDLRLGGRLLVTRVC